MFAHNRHAEAMPAGHILKLTHKEAALEAKSDVCDCVVVLCDDHFVADSQPSSQSHRPIVARFHSVSEFYILGQIFCLV